MTESIEDLPPNDESLAVQTLDSTTLEPPTSRVGPVWAVRNRIAQMRKNDSTRALRRDKIQRWIDGARPYSSSKLIEVGQGDRTNFNPREADAMTDAAKAPYYSLVFRNPRYASVRVDYGNNRQQQAQWGDSIAVSFHQMLDEWDEFDYNMQLKFLNMILFGVGVAMFPDDENWQWQSRKMSEFLVPDGVPSSIKKLPEACYFRKISPVDLFALIEKEESAKAMGWFPARAKRAIVKIAPQALQSTTNTMFGEEWSEEYTASLRRGDVMWNAEDAQIRLAGYLIKEFDGRITHCILIDDPALGTGGDEELLLFKKVGQYDSFEQVAQPFFHDIGTGEWHSVRALGPKIRDLTIANARLFCTMIDGAMKGSVFLFQALEATGEEVSQLIEIAGANIIPASLKLEQNRIADSLEGPINVRREVQSTLQTTSAQYLPRVSSENSEPTLGQAQLNYRNQQQLSESDSDRYLKRLDRLFKETLRRALIMGVKCYRKRHPEDEPPEEYEVPSFPNDAEEGAYWFVKRAVDANVPLEVLDPKYICSVKATRGSGGGSPAAVDISTRELISLLPTMDERSRRNALRQRVAFLMGQNNVDEYYPPFDEAEMPDDNAALATLENNALRQEDGEVLITPLQDHVIHFGYHFADCAQDLEALKNGQSKRGPVPVLIHCHQAGVHMKGHLDQIAGDETRKSSYDKMFAAWNDLAKLTDQLQQQVEESLKAQKQPEPQVSPEMMSAVMKAKGELQLKEFKIKGDMALKAEKQKQTNRLKDLNSAFQMNLKKREADMQAAIQIQQAAQPELKVA
jgi:hypothetical protein